MQAFEEQKSKNTGSSLKLENGVLDYRTKTEHDTIYIPGKDSLIYVPVDVSGPVTNVLTWWQQFWINWGKLLSAGIVLCLLARSIIKQFK